jgi:hypothetical protein
MTMPKGWTPDKIRKDARNYSLAAEARKLVEQQAAAKAKEEEEERRKQEGIQAHNITNKPQPRGTTSDTNNSNKPPGWGRKTAGKIIAIFSFVTVLLTTIIGGWNVVGAVFFSFFLILLPGWALYISGDRKKKKAAVGFKSKPIDKEAVGAAISFIIAIIGAVALCWGFYMIIWSNDIDAPVLPAILGGIFLLIAGLVGIPLATGNNESIFFSSNRRRRY